MYNIFLRPMSHNLHYVISPFSFFFGAFNIPKFSLSFEKNRLILGDLITEKYVLYE